MAELADALDLGSSGATLESSSLSDRTNLKFEEILEKNYILNASGLNTLELTLSKSEVQPVLDEAYAEAQRSISLPGFRKGKVPLDMIKKMYGKAIEAEANLDIVNRFFPQIVEEDNLKLIDTPSLKDVQRTDEGYKFIIGFQTAPHFEVSGYKDFEIYEPIYVVKPEDVDNELNVQAQELAKRTPANEVESYNYHVYYGIEEIKEGEEDIHQHDENQEEHNHHHHHDHQDIFLGDDRVKSEFKELFLNRKVGDELIFSEGDKQFKIVIERIEKVELPDIDDEFAKLASQNKFDNLADYRQHLELALQDYWDNKSRQEIENQIIDHLILSNPEIIPPDKMVETALENIIENLKQQYRIPKENKQYDQFFRESYYTHAVNLAKWTMIKDKLIEVENIKLEDYDINDWIEKNRQYLDQFNMTDEQLRSIIETNENLKGEILQKKLIDILLGFATTNEISFEDYYKKRQIEMQPKSEEKSEETNSDED